MSRGGAGETQQTTHHGKPTISRDTSQSRKRRLANTKPHHISVVEITNAFQAAEDFVNHYYESLNKRQPLAAYYASTSSHLTSASVKPDISINGRVVESIAAYEALLDAQGANVHYTVTSFDAHPVNPNYALGCPENLSAATNGGEANGPGWGKINKSVKDGDRVSFAVQVRLVL